MHTVVGLFTPRGDPETFNGSLRDECLNIHWFKTLTEVKLFL